MIGRSGWIVRNGYGERVSCWIDFMDFRIDGDQVLPERRAVWHDRPFKASRHVDDGQVVELSMAWRTHDELEDQIEHDENAQIEANRREMDALRSSAIRKSGRAITWLPRKIRDRRG